jgi:hypothetical protein
VLHPESSFRYKWDLVLMALLVCTCVVVPMRIAFEELFDEHRTTWDAIDLFIEWYLDPT